MKWIRIALMLLALVAIVAGLVLILFAPLRETLYGTIALIVGSGVVLLLRSTDTKSDRDD